MVGMLGHIRRWDLMGSGFFSALIIVAVYIESGYTVVFRFLLIALPFCNFLYFVVRRSAQRRQPADGLHD